VRISSVAGNGRCEKQTSPDGRGRRPKADAFGAHGSSASNQEGGRGNRGSGTRGSVLVCHLCRTTSPGASSVVQRTNCFVRTPVRLRDQINGRRLQKTRLTSQDKAGGLSTLRMVNGAIKENDDIEAPAPPREACGPTPDLSVFLCRS